ncbi:MAG: hypothetical protein JWL75_705 [Parcubacteria group bacterium]|nr:hypothetical protein [Parcubacteria group bacterium]
MENFTKEELEKAVVVITSLVSKSEKAKTNLVKGHLTLVENRIHALKIALVLLQKEIGNR